MQNNTDLTQRNMMQCAAIVWSDCWHLLHQW